MISLVRITSGFVFFFLSVLPAFADERKEPSTDSVPYGSGGVAVVDMEKVFKEYVAFQSAKETLEAEIQELDASIKQEREGNQKLRDGLKDLKKGSEEYKALELESAKQMSTLQRTVDQERQRFAKSEREMYLAAYEKIKATVADIAKRDGIRFVIRKTQPPVQVERGNSDSVLKYLNQQILYNDGSVNDITERLLAVLNTESKAKTEVSSPSSPGQSD